MRRKRQTHSPKLLAALLVVAALVGGAWYLLHRPDSLAPPWQSANAPNATPAAPRAVAIDRIDPANEGRHVLVSGALRATVPARDTELGIGPANAIALLRQVEMRQWQETCSAGTCEYALVWADKPIDWHAFRTPSGHANSMPFPFSSQRFLAAGVRLGAFKVDPALAATAAEPVAYPIHIAQLPPNLAATFREDAGVLYTGTTGAAAAAGDLRIGYRIVPAGQQRLNAIQKGDRLAAPPR